VFTWISSFAGVFRCWPFANFVRSPAYAGQLLSSSRCRGRRSRMARRPPWSWSPKTVSAACRATARSPSYRAQPGDQPAAQRRRAIERRDSPEAKPGTLLIRQPPSAGAAAANRRGHGAPQGGGSGQGNDNAAPKDPRNPGSNDPLDDWVWSRVWSP
jgi:hypothetical protein